MPDITITVTANQAQRISAAFGPPPAGMTQLEWVILNTKLLWKGKVRENEVRAASNIAYDAAMSLVETDFGGF